MNNNEDKLPPEQEALLRNMTRLAEGEPFVPQREPIETNTPRAGETPEQTALRYAPRNIRDNPLLRQEGGSHYKDTTIQPIEYAYANNLNYLETCVVKRITRWRKKDGLLDLKKIIHEVELLIKLEGLEEKPK